MVHHFTLVSKQPPGVECESLSDLVNIVVNPSVLNVPVVIDHLPGVPLEGVCLQGIPLDEEGVPTTIGIDIIECIFRTIRDNLPCGISHGDLGNIIPGIREKDCSSTPGRPYTPGEIGIEIRIEIIGDSYRNDDLGSSPVLECDGGSHLRHIQPCPHNGHPCINVTVDWE